MYLQRWQIPCRTHRLSHETQDSQKFPLREYFLPMRFRLQPSSKSGLCQEAARVLSSAEAIRAQAQASADEWTAKHAGIEAERDRILADARKEAEAVRDSALRQVAEELATRRSAGEAAITAERDKMRRRLDDDAGELAVQIAEKLLERLPQRPDMPFLEGLLGQLDQLPSEERARLSKERDVTLVSAGALNATDQARSRDVLAKTMGDGVTIRFRHDPALIAGVELRAPTLHIRNNWRADLDRIRTSLARGTQGEPDGRSANLA